MVSAGPAPSVLLLFVIEPNANVSTPVEPSAGAEIVLFIVQTQLFDLDPQWHLNLWLIGVGSGIALITVLGLLRSKNIITAPPLQSLRQLY